MPLQVTELAPGDRVLLNCPKCRTQQKRQAEFHGIFATWTLAMTSAEHPVTLMPIGLGDLNRVSRHMETGGRWARFLLETSTAPMVRLEGSGFTLPNPRGDAVCLLIALAVDAEGRMRDDEGRQIFIERRLARPQEG